MSGENVKLVIHEAKVKGGEFQLTYELTNGSGSTIFLYNILPDTYALRGRRPSQFPRTDLGQTSWSPPNTAVILLGPAPIPNSGPRRSFIGFYKPSLSKIRAGNAFRGTIKARLPMIEWSDTCGPRPERNDLSTVEVKRLRLVAIYVREEDAENIKRHPLIWTCYDLTALEEHRIQIEQDISSLALTLVTNPGMIRFE